MTRFFKLALFGLAIAGGLVLAPVSLHGDTKPAASPPRPAQIMDAKKVFVSNAGENPNFEFKPERSYNQLYAALKDWGRYELVSAPSDADLIFEIRLVGELKRLGKDLDTLPILELAILDPKTHTVLWTFAEELEVSGFVGAHRDQKFDKAMSKLVDDLKRVAATPASASAKP